MNFKRRTLKILILIVFLFGCSVAVAAADGNESVGPEQFAGKQIGVVADTNYVDNVNRMFDDPDVCYYQNAYDLFAALSAGKVDAIAVNEAVIRYNLQTASDIDYFVVGTEKAEKTALIMSPNATGKKLQKEFNAFIVQLQQSDSLEILQKKWFDGEGKQDMTDYTELPAANGIITVAVDPTYAPFVFLKDDLIVGYEIELAVLFCEEYGYGMEVSRVDSEGIITGIAEGRYDIGAAGFNISEDSEQFVYFTDPIFECPLTAAYKIDSEIAISDFAGKKVAVQADSFYVDEVYHIIQSPEVCHYLTSRETMDAVASGEADCCVLDNLISAYYLPQYENLNYLCLETEYPIGFVGAKNQKGTDLINEFNQFSANMEKTGDLKKLQDKWIEGDETERTMSVDYHQLEDKSGTVTFAVCPEYPPFEYKKDGAIVGYEIELAALFCREKGYRLEIEEVDFSSIVSGVASGKYDFGASTITISEERAQKVVCSNPVYYCSTYILYKDDTKTDTPFWIKWKNSFTETLFAENRTSSFLAGIWVTLSISVLTIVFGLCIGFLAYLPYRKNRKIVVKAVNAVMWIVRGIPEVVLLMILFYVVFAGTNLSGLIVSVVCFVLIFSCAVLELLRSGESSVDYGQKIAAKSLGYSDSKAFFKIILPQSAASFLPSLHSEIIAMIKSTAVVGYISVVDVTKVADIIRGSTYDAFSPLIAVAIIYYLLTSLFGFFTRQIEKKVNPKNRTEKRITKGFVIK